MKLLFIFLSSIAIANSGGSQVKNSSMVPQNIIVTFTARYPSAHNTGWKLEKDGYTANFKMDKKKYCAMYSAAGQWQKTERVIRPWNMPAVLKQALKKSDYAAWYIDGVKEVNMPGKHIYLVNVDNANVLTITDAYLFKDDYQLTFSETGELTYKEKLP